MTALGILPTTMYPHPGNSPTPERDTLYNCPASNQTEDITRVCERGEPPPGVLQSRTEELSQQAAEFKRDMDANKRRESWMAWLQYGISDILRTLEGWWPFQRAELNTMSGEGSRDSGSSTAQRQKLLH